jgi:hypothetical protein
VAAIDAGHPATAGDKDGGQEYTATAEVWTQTGNYSNDAASLAPQIRRLPGYPAFLALFQPFDPAYRYQIVSVAQVVLAHLWLLLVAGWMARRFGGTSATVFVVLLSLSITWIHYPATVHSDFQFAVLVFTGIALMLECTVATAKRWARCSMAVLCIAAASLTRPDLIVFPVWLLLSYGVTVFVNRRHQPDERSIDARPQLFVALGMTAAILLWSLRNFLAAGRFTYTSVFDFAVRLFGGEDPSAPLQAATAGAGGQTGLALIDMAWRIADNIQTLMVNFIPALAEMFLSPGRWYLQRYLEALGARSETHGIPFSSVGFGGLPPVEQIYVAGNIAVATVIFAAFAWFLYRFVRGKVPISRSWGWLGLWALLYLVVQKGTWVAFGGGDGPRYSMSMIPFVVFFASLCFAPAKTEQ